jgi:hypothetical protein
MHFYFRRSGECLLPWQAFAVGGWVGGGGEGGVLSKLWGGGEGGGTGYEGLAWKQGRAGGSEGESKGMGMKSTA